MIFGKRKTAPPVRVELTVQGLLGTTYLSVLATIEVPGGASLRDALDALRRRGELDPEAHALLRDVPEPLTLLVNGAPVTGRGRAKTRLADGDQVTILTPVSGG